MNYIYFRSSKLNGVYKIGITDNPARRNKEILGAGFGGRYILCLPILFGSAAKVELKFKRLLSDKKKPFANGSGKTEFFKLGFFDFCYVYFSVFSQSFSRVIVFGFLVWVFVLVVRFF